MGQGVALPLNYYKIDESFANTIDVPLEISL